TLIRKGECAPAQREIRGSIFNPNRSQVKYPSDAARCESSQSCMLYFLLNFIAKNATVKTYYQTRQ
uniref:Uncharacterized protein n=1 Tax=Romanomermis culicivorax TaxID=13658 RepID=A0A915HQU7_ROMCU